MRGKGFGFWNNDHLVGITPACAGKRPRSAGQTSRRQDHPRMCGEKRLQRSGTGSPLGSPPHVRGKGPCRGTGGCFWGITPACAGKSFGASSEKSDKMGSPPHVRGKVHLTGAVVVGGGITPACAGKRLKRSRSTVPHAAIVPLFPSVCNKPAGSDGSPAGHDAPPFLPIENAAPASPAYNLRSL